jgi:hypothetical protein
MYLYLWYINVQNIIHPAVRPFLNPFLKVLDLQIWHNNISDYQIHIFMYLDVMSAFLSL